MVIDFEGFVDDEPFEGGDARGFLLELGSGRLIPGFEEQLAGAKAGDEREVKVTFPDDYQAEHLAGKEATFKVSVKEVKEKRLPELDDDLAIEAGGYDSLDELKEDVRTRLRQAHEDAIEREYREAAVDAVAAEAKIDVPHDLVHAKAHEMWHVTARRLQAQGLDPAQYLQITNKTEEELVTESEPDAERALRREAALAAVVETEGIEVSDDEMLDALRQASTQPGEKEPSEKALRRSLEKAKKRGTDEALREDIAMRKAVDLIVERAKPIPIEQAKAREELWTPEKEEKAEGSGEIWTPGSLGPTTAPSLDSPRHEPTGPNGRRADLSRRARVRHLLPPAERAHRLPRHPGHRRDRQPDRRAAAPPRVRGSGQGHLDLHQLAGRLGVRGARDLRHDAVHQARRADDLRRHRDVDGRAAARRAAPRASAWRCPTRRS